MVDLTDWTETGTTETGTKVSTPSSDIGGTNDLVVVTGAVDYDDSDMAPSKPRQAPNSEQRRRFFRGIPRLSRSSLFRANIKLPMIMFYC